MVNTKLMCAALVAACAMMGSALETIKLPPVNFNMGKTALQALEDRHSDRPFAEKDLTPVELSGLVWAANGFNRPDKRTNATALNKQEIVIFISRKDGTYRYDARQHALVPVSEGDLRPAFAGHQDYANTAPVVLP